MLRVVDGHRTDPPFAGGPGGRDRVPYVAQARPSPDRVERGCGSLYKVELVGENQPLDSPVAVGAELKADGVHLRIGGETMRFRLHRKRAART